jgi:hypothetical protein
MLKQSLILVALSAAIILSMSYAQHGLQLLVSGHDWISQLLTEVFSAGHAGSLARSLIALLSIPLFAGLIPTFIYWIVRRHWFPYFMEIVWVVWLLQAGALIMMYKAAA